jgi:signal transduction histidine kinase
MREPRVSVAFAPELHARLRWFSGLRWLAVAGLAAFSFAGVPLGFEAAWPALLLVAAFVAIYNSYFLVRLRRSTETIYQQLRAFALSQIGLDIFALLVTAHFTGGMRSPALLFFAFHMAIGTIMLAAVWMYLVAGAASAGVVGLFALEHFGVLEHHWPGATSSDPYRTGLLALAAVIALFGTVYLTATVTDRFKRHTVRMKTMTETLRERNEEQRRLIEEIAELERRKAHYMRISAHQLRSPLGTIKTSLQVLNDGFVEGESDRGKKLMRGALDRADGLLAIVNDLLELAKMREGRQKAPWARNLSLNQLLADVVDSLAPLAEGREVRLDTSFDGVAVLAWGVPPDLVHAFENLLHNAIKYSPPGATVSVRLRTETDHAVVEIADEGIGIEPDLIEDVFLEFVRTPRGKRHAEEGTGLGLAIARAAFEAHGGTVGVSSRLGQGSTFEIRLPLGHVPREVTRA